MFLIIFTRVKLVSDLATQAQGEGVEHAHFGLPEFAAKR